MGISCGLNLHLDASATVCMVSRRGLGKGKHVDMQNMWIQGASKSGRFVTQKVGTSVNPADLMTKPLLKPRIEQLMNHGIVEKELMNGRVAREMTEARKGGKKGSKGSKPD